MNAITKILAALAAAVFAAPLYADNQTLTTSTIQPNAALPFRIKIKQANFTLPVGIHSGVVGFYQGLWVFIAGRTNGLHGFGGDPFPPDSQNTSIIVVDPVKGKTYMRDLFDPSSGLNKKLIDSLSVTSPQGYQEGDTLYMSGGYGFEKSTSRYDTKPLFTAIYLPGIVRWVLEPKNKKHSVIANIKQISNPIFQITGGKMVNEGGVVQLIFGQNFDGVYTPASNGNYSEQVRRFQITNNKGKLGVNILKSIPEIPDPSYRRRDLNILPALLNDNNTLHFGNIAYGGVFTLTSGVWTVPVVINARGKPSMANPDAATTFKQGMNQYVSAAASLYSRRGADMYHILFGGISYGYFAGGVFTTDDEDPFINQVTTIKMNKFGYFTQYLMSDEYPVILSTASNPGNPLLFGAGAYFIPNVKVQRYPNNVINLDSITKPTVIGYIVGGIQSTVPNTSTDSDSAGSNYVFTVTVVPQ